MTALFRLFLCSKKQKSLYKSELFQESTKGTLLVSYQHKVNKNVCPLLSFHKSCGTIEKKQKPKIIHFYNKTKCGVDVVDNMLRKYTTKSKTNHWPLAVFFKILDKAALNAHIVIK